VAHRTRKGRGGRVVRVFKLPRTGGGTGTRTVSAPSLSLAEESTSRAQVRARGPSSLPYAVVLWLRASRLFAVEGDFDPDTLTPTTVRMTLVGIGVSNFLSLPTPFLSRSVRLSSAALPSFNPHRLLLPLLRSYRVPPCVLVRPTPRRDENFPLLGVTENHEILCVLFSGAPVKGTWNTHITEGGPRRRRIRDVGYQDGICTLPVDRGGPLLAKLCAGAAAEVLAAPKESLH